MKGWKKIAGWTALATGNGESYIGKTKSNKKKSMAAKGKTSVIEDLLTLATRLPWWMDIFSAILSYVVFHMLYVHITSVVATLDPPPAPVANPVTAAVNSGFPAAFRVLGKIFAAVFQYLLPVVFLLGGAASFFRRKKI